MLFTDSLKLDIVFKKEKTPPATNYVTDGVSNALYFFIYRLLAIFSAARSRYNINRPTLTLHRHRSFLYFDFGQFFATINTSHWI